MARDRQRHGVPRRRARPSCATFLCFSDYMRPSVRLAALNELPVDLRLDARLDRPRRGRPDAPAGRAPDVAARDAGAHVIRPADANEAAEAWRRRIEHGERPVGAGPHAPEAARSSTATGSRRRRASARGAYVLARGVGARRRAHPDRDRLRGRTRARGARDSSKERGSRRASCRCPAGSSSTRSRAEYREQVLPPRGPARASRSRPGRTLGWKRCVGDGGDSIGLDRFGASAPGEIVMEELGFTVENVVRRGRRLCCEDRRRRRSRRVRAEDGDRSDCSRRRATRSRTSAPTMPARPTIRISPGASAELVVSGACERGVLVCGSGVGASSRGEQGAGDPRRALPRHVLGPAGRRGRRHERPLPGSARHRAGARAGGPARVPRARVSPAPSGTSAGSARSRAIEEEARRGAFDREQGRPV